MWDPDVELHDACPACGELVRVAEDVILGETVVCDNCGVELEVIGLTPVRLDFYEDEEK